MEMSQKAKPNFIRIFIAKPLIIEENWKEPKCPTVRALAKPRIAYQLSGLPCSHRALSRWLVSMCGNVCMK